MISPACLEGRRSIQLSYGRTSCIDFKSFIGRYNTIMAASTLCRRGRRSFLMHHERSLSDLEQLEALTREVPPAFQPLVSVRSVQFDARVRAASGWSLPDFVTHPQSEESAPGYFSHPLGDPPPRVVHRMRLLRATQRNPMCIA